MVKAGEFTGTMLIRAGSEACSATRGVEFVVRSPARFVRLYRPWSREAIRRLSSILLPPRQLISDSGYESWRYSRFVIFRLDRYLASRWADRAP